MRKPNGTWKGLNEAQIVIVAALDTAARQAEISAYLPEDRRAALDANLSARSAANPRFKASAPVFVCLDPVHRTSPSAVGSGLRERAIWQITLPLRPDEAQNDTAARTP
jgi:hypothetical protein